MARNALDCRAAAALCLAAVADGASLSQQLPLHANQVKPRDQALYRQLCYGVLRLYPRLNAYLSQLLDKPLKAKDRDVQMLILLGIYQLLELRVPDHAAVSATVSATRALKKPWSKNLVNGVLRNWQRRQADADKDLSDAERAAHPEWLHQRILQAWPQQAQAIEAANNTHPPMCLRINRRRQSREEYLQQLAAVAIEASACNDSEEGIRLHTAVDVEQLPGFATGCVSVQDEAAQLSAGLLQLQPGQRLLDACCAPGGKTSHCLELEPGLAELVALDIDEQRLQRVQQNLDRLDLNATLLCADAANTDQWWNGEGFDRILLDAPCSATGVIRRNPDIKLHRRASDIDRLQTLQLQLLKTLWPTLSDDGLLLYATCTILPAENEQVIEQFLLEESSAEAIPIEANWGIERPFGRQLFPRIDGHDGFYYALLRKKAAKHGL